MRLPPKSAWVLTVAIALAIFLELPSSVVGSQNIPLFEAEEASDATFSISNSSSEPASVTLTVCSYDGNLLRGTHSNPVPINVFPFNAKKLCPKNLQTAPLLPRMDSLNSSFSYVDGGKENYAVIASMKPRSPTESILIDAFIPQGYAFGFETVSVGPKGHWPRLLREVFLDLEIKWVAPCA